MQDYFNHERKEETLYNYTIFEEVYQMNKILGYAWTREIIIYMKTMPHTHSFKIYIYRSYDSLWIRKHKNVHECIVYKLIKWVINKTKYLTLLNQQNVK